MRFVIMGSGGVGGYFGARLAEAGEDVTFVARGDHLTAIRRNGLKLKSIEGNATITSAKATDDPAGLGEVDTVIVAVKAWQVASAAEAIRPLIGPNTLVLPLQNGVEAAGQLAAVLGEERVLDGLCGILAWRERPGVIRHAGVSPFIRLGTRLPSQAADTETLRATLDRATGISAEIPDDIEAAVWSKFLFICAMSGIGALTRAPIGITRKLPETRELICQILDEIDAVARARGVALPDDAIDRALGFLDSLQEGSTASMQRDIVAGNPSELDSQNGAVVRLGRTAGVPTPINTMIYAALLPQENAARSRS